MTSATNTIVCRGPLPVDGWTRFDRWAVVIVTLAGLSALGVACAIDAGFFTSSRGFPAASSSSGSSSGSPGSATTVR